MPSFGSNIKGAYCQDTAFPLSPGVDVVYPTMVWIPFGVRFRGGNPEGSYSTGTGESFLIEKITVAFVWPGFTKISKCPRFETLMKFEFSGRNKKLFVIGISTLGQPVTSRNISMDVRPIGRFFLNHFICGHKKNHTKNGPKIIKAHRAVLMLSPTIRVVRYNPQRHSAAQQGYN